MEELDILDVLRKRMWMIIAFSMVATLAAYAASFLLATQYKSSAIVLVRPQQKITLDSGSSRSREFLDFPIGQASVETPSKTYIEIIKSPAFVEQLVRKLALEAADEPEPGFLSRHMPSAWKSSYDNLKQAATSSLTFLVYGSAVPENRFANAVKLVQNNLALEARSDTFVFTISYSGKTALQAAEVANAAAKLFVDYMEKVHLAEGQYALDRLRAQVDESRQQLENDRQRLQEFKKKHAIFRTESEYTNELKLIADLEGELAKVNENLASLLSVASQSSLSTISLVAKRDNLRDSIARRKAALLSLPEMERELKQLELREKVDLSAYEIVEKAYQEVEIKNAYAGRDVQLVSEAVPSRLPAGLSKLLIALVALFSAIVIGIGLAFVLEYLNRRIRGVRDVEEFVGLKVLATIPDVRLTSGKANSRASAQRYVA
jgi:uncharacterized protein involved in exopolysaccharide biosynthesis